MLQKGGEASWIDWSVSTVQTPGPKNVTSARWWGLHLGCVSCTFVQWAGMEKRFLLRYLCCWSMYWWTTMPSSLGLIPVIKPISTLLSPSARKQKKIIIVKAALPQGQDLGGSEQWVPTEQSNLKTNIFIVMVGGKAQLFNFWMTSRLTELSPGHARKCSRENRPCVF